VDDNVTAAVDQQTRQSTMRNHTAAHLLQQALRDVLGEHVHQSGSYVDSHRLRFDFSHFEAVREQELQRVEAIVNDKILEFLPVSHRVLPIEEARKQGAIALFGEKYGDSVRVIDASGYSIEFCGGTHVDNTGRLGLFRILSESSVAAGIRRIEATTGKGVLEQIHAQQDLIKEVCTIVKANSAAELVERALATVHALKNTSQQLEQMRSREASSQADRITVSASINGTTVYASRFEGSVEALRAAAIAIRDKDPESVTLLATIEEGKISLCCTCGSEAQKKGLKAGNIVKQAAVLVGGSGGGRPDIAMAGGKDASAIDSMLAALAEIVEKQVQ
jgi:alanyl-tRNA synthetase